MKIGFVGCGKLGMPVMLAINYKGHEVMGYDINPARMTTESYPHREDWNIDERTFAEALSYSSIQFGTLEQVVEWADIVFMAVQTPHDPKYEGITRLPNKRSDFDYTYLVKAMTDISACVANSNRTLPVVIISTALPGTIRREILPIIGPRIMLHYNPYFIAMGTVVDNFLHPEFVLIGCLGDASLTLLDFYKDITHDGYCTPHYVPIHVVSIESAELAKVAYNTFITMKIVFANTIMEIAHDIDGCDVDDVMHVLKTADHRIISTAYLNGGMGDGGGCHPRDNIALSSLARNLDLSYDLFGSLMHARETQTEWLAKKMLSHSKASGLPMAIVGLSFKPETNLTIGSPSTLLYNILKSLIEGCKCGCAFSNVIIYDPYIDAEIPLTLLNAPHVILIGTKHECLADCSMYAPGSIIIDPHRYVTKLPPKGNYIGLGQGNPDLLRENNI